jgi:hypothetical protein
LFRCARAMIGYLAGHHSLFPNLSNGSLNGFFTTNEGRVSQLVHAVMQTIEICRPSVVYLMEVSS